MPDTTSPTAPYPWSVPGGLDTPADACAVGCGWRDGAVVELEGFFIVRSPVPEDADFALIHATNTLLAFSWPGIAG